MKKAVMISCFGWYERRLAPIKELISKEYETTIYMGDFIHSTKETVTKQFDDCRYIHINPYKKNISLKRLYSHFNFSKQIYRILKKEKPDLIYALIPPNSVANYCAKYKRKNPECRLVFDVIDMWPESMPLGKIENSPPGNIWRDLRNKALTKADYVYTECEFYQKELYEVLPERFGTLYLLKKQTTEQKQLIHKIISEKEENELKKIDIGYVGSINNIIDIDNIVKIVNFLKQYYEIRIHIIGDGESRESLIKQLNSQMVKVEYYGKVFEEFQKIKILASCDVALNLMKSSVKVGLTIKSLDYFSYGLPIINNIKGDTWNLLGKEMPGFNFEYNYKELLEFVQKIDKSMHFEVFNTYEKYFSLEAFNKQLEDCFMEL
ncbi:MAG: glycosyltransferase [Lachnospiraceae bacterium]|nr:glycosyltransferase [Lachnospiraceae bacterium]